MRMIAACILAVLWLVPGRVEASSGYSTSIATPSFRYSFSLRSRKIFRDEQQREQYMKQHDRRAKAHFLAFEAKAAAAIAAAKKRGTPIGAYDLFLETVHFVEPAEIKTYDRDEYPLNVVLVASTDEAEILFEVTATRPWTPKQLAQLTSALARIAKPAPPDPDPERAQREQALVDAADFQAPVAATHIDERFGLYVGTTTEIAKKHRPRVLARLQATLDKLVPKVRARLAAKNVPAPLRPDVLAPIKPLVDAHPQKLPRAFHPWGPAVSGNLVRKTRDLGRVAVILMVAPTAKQTWQDIAPALQTILAP